METNHLSIDELQQLAGGLDDRAEGIKRQVSELNRQLSEIIRQRQTVDLELQSRLVPEFLESRP